MADKGKKAYDNVIYDLFLWVFTVVVDLFFREIHPRSTWRIPKKGPVLFVAAPHANQFVDPIILMRTVRHDAHRRIAFLVAEKSMRRKFIGFFASLVGAVPVGRALDLKKPAQGIIYLPEPESDPTLVRGEGTNFEDPQFMKQGLLVLPSFQNTAANAEIAEILGPNEIRLKKPFKGEVAEQQLAGLDPKDPEAYNGTEKPKKGSKFSVAPHVDQHAVYDTVFDRVAEGGCIGIFPEGGSHDRTELLPLKAGLAIMALGSLAKNPDCNVSIVPVGMNYFNAHKFRSRCVIEFGQPITVSDKVLEQYKAGDRREAVGSLLNEVQDALKSVTLQAPDYDTLMLIQAVRRLYNPKGKKLPLPAVVELQRRFLKGYALYKDDPRVMKTRKAVLDYNKQLMHIGVRDHQVSYAKFPWYRGLAYLFYRLAKLVLLSIAVIPGLVFFSPVFIAGKIISIKKSKEALAASSVKIKARDVVATWKILVSLALAPALNVVYTIIGTYWAHKNRVGGRIPEWVPLWSVILFQIILFPAACFAALRFGEIGMDILKSIRPLVLSLNPNSSSTLVKLRERRAKLQAEITEIVDELGPELFPDFDKQRIIPDQKQEEQPVTPSHRRHGSEGGENDIFSFTPATPPSPSSSRKPYDQLPRNESFQNIGSVGFFASRPSTPNRSRSRTNSASDGFKLTPMTSLTSTKEEPKSNMEEVSRNLHEALRARRGRRQSQPNTFEFADEDGTSEEDDEEPTKKNI